MKENTQKKSYEAPAFSDVETDKLIMLQVASNKTLNDKESNLEEEEDDRWGSKGL